MKRRRPLSPRFVLWLTISCALASACVKPPPPKVAIENLQSDILFGAPPEQVAAAAPTQQIPAQEDLSPLDFPSFAQPAPRPFVPLAPSGDCPTAPFTAFPDESASTNVEQPPKEGAYKWQRSGFVTASQRSISLTGLQRSLVRRITEGVDPGASAPSATPSRTFSFQTVQPIADMKLISDFQVRTNGQAGDPERGVVLKRMVLQNPNGSSAFSFSPQPVGLLYLPLPVAPAAVFTSEAVDATTAERWSLSGKVAGRQRVDACGDLVEGWLVEADLTFSGARSGTQKFEYVIAPQRGGAIVREKWAGEGHIKGNANAEFIIGQLSPDPLTQAEK